MKISFSKVKTWRTCHKKFDYHYNQKLRKKKRANALVIGDVVHQALEAFYKGKNWKKVLKQAASKYNKMFAEEKEFMDDLPVLTQDLMQRYLDNWEDADLEPLAVEQEFCIEIAKGIELEGKIDLIATDSKDRVWVEEHKTAARMPDEAVRMADTQTVIYGHVLPLIGFKKPAGVIWDYLRKKVPSVPEPLKSGLSLSKAKNIDTTPEIYLAAIHRHGFDPDDYEDILEKLEGKEEAFFKRVRLPISNNLIKSTLKDMVSSGEQIRDFGELWTDRNMNKDCGFCEYFALCQCEVRGARNDHIKEHDYEISKGRPKNGKTKKESKSKESKSKKVKQHRTKNKTSVRNRIEPSNKRGVVRKKRDR